MDQEETQQAILIELRMIRRAVRAILFIIVVFIILAVLSAAYPQIGTAALIAAGILAVAAVIGALLGIGSAKVINTIRNR